jgi:hypothetical protein
MLALGELTDLLEQDLGLNWVNILFALPVAVIAVAIVAVGGDIFLEAIERRRGWRLPRRLETTMSAGIGLAATIDIALRHVRQAPHLDASLGLAGGALLVIAAGLHRYAPGPVSDSQARRTNRSRARPPALGSARARRLMRTRRHGSRRSTAPH